MHLVGTYSVKIDAKGRVILPAPLKRELADRSEDMFLIEMSMHDKCINVYPSIKWDERIDRIKSKLNIDSNRGEAMMRAICSRAQEVKIASNGRLNIPSSMLTLANLDSDVVVVGSYNKITLWSPDNYQEMERSNDALMVDLDELLK